MLLSVMDKNDKHRARDLRNIPLESLQFGTGKVWLILGLALS